MGKFKEIEIENGETLQTDGLLADNYGSENDGIADNYVDSNQLKLSSAFESAVLFAE